MRTDTYEPLVRQLYQAFESGDLDLIGVRMADDVVWHEPGRSSLAGDYKGPQTVLDFLGRLRAQSASTFSLEILDVLSEPGRAVVFHRETASKVDRDLDVIAAVDFEFHQGKITEATVYHTDQYAFDEFWGD